MPDTNCLLASLSRQGRTYPVWKGFQKGHYILCVSTEILEEYEEIIAEKTTPSLAKNVVDLIVKSKNVVQVNTYYHWNLITALLAALVIAFSSCNSDEPHWADPEAHEKTEQLREQYGPLMVGTWHYEKVGESQRFFEQLAFKDDGTFTGIRKWQTRQLVTVDSEQRYTDWETLELSGSFSGTWSLRYWAPDGGEKRNCLQLSATYDGAEQNYMAYSTCLTFGYADETTLHIQAYYVHDDDGWVDYLRGDTEPSF